MNEEVKEIRGLMNQLIGELKDIAHDESRDRSERNDAMILINLTMIMDVVMNTFLLTREVKSLISRLNGLIVIGLLFNAAVLIIMTIAIFM